MKKSTNDLLDEFDIDNPYLSETVAQAAFASDDYPYNKSMKRSHYEEELEHLQIELGKMQRWVRESRARIVIVFEGRDAAGKGGTIKAFKEFLNPRHLNVVALSKPTETERGQWYFQRYVTHLPTTGDMTFYDRSWYNRAGVEPVMGFCTNEQHKMFLKEVPRFEDILVDDGVHLFKIWLNVGQEMQLKRFHDRRHSPLKSWKLSPIDLKALTKWDEYTKARDIMMEHTHTKYAPWTIIKSNDKKRARLNAIRHVLLSIDYEGKNKDTIGKTDDKILRQDPDFLSD